MGKCPTHISDSKKQRLRMVMARRGLIRSHDNQLPENITTEEVICKNCGFKARYKFHRCPHCEEIQK